MLLRSRRAFGVTTTRVLWTLGRPRTAIPFPTSPLAGSDPPMLHLRCAGPFLSGVGHSTEVASQIY
jgi:hypothetical protein